MTPIAACSPGCARVATQGRAAWSWSISSRKSTATIHQGAVSGAWREVLNTDAEIYGGSNVGNAGAVRTLDEGTIPEVSLAIPPLAAIFLVPER
jgi:1,4-alpha-glucan branching enzyme